MVRELVGRDEFFEVFVDGPDRGLHRPRPERSL